MKNWTSWRPALLGAVLGTLGGASPQEGMLHGLWAFPSARADESATALPGSGGKVAASAHASASVTASGSGQGCVAESTAEAEAAAGDQHQSNSDHKRRVQASGPCNVGANARAEAVAGPPKNSSDPE